MATSRKTLLGFFVLALVWGFSLGFINPNFTPKDLVEQSTNVVVLEFKNVDAKGVAAAVVQKVLKDGQKDADKFKAKEIKIDLMAGITEADGESVIERIKDGNKQAIMFVGKFTGNEQEGQQPVTEPVAYIHLGGSWLVASWEEKAGTWDMERPNDLMNATWSGGTDMLLRAVKYVLANPKEADFPVRDACEWDKELHVGKIGGKVFTAQAVDLAGDGKLDLFLAAEKGDRLYRWNQQKKAFDDITARSGLTSTSHTFAWGDFNSDGRVDLASWNGKELSILSQAADGTFTAKVVDTGGALQECLALTTFDAGGETKKGRPALLASTTGSPLELLVQDDGSAKAKALISGEPPAKDLGAPGECLVADFDNDGLPDILQLFAKGSLLHRGTKVGEFAPPTKLAMGFGAGRHASCIGDWDQDGLLDVFTCSEQRDHLWQNLGGGKFADATELSGFLAWGSIFVQTSDFNNDGRQGLMMLYRDRMAPQLRFNRGFRSFGYSYSLSQKTKDLKALNDGQQAGFLADFSAIGVPSLMVVLNDGNIWFLPRKLTAPPLGLTVALSTASPTPGPVTIEAHNAARSFGAAVIRAGEPGQFYGVEQSGPVTLTWRFPGQPAQQKEVMIEDHTLRLVVDKAEGRPVQQH